MSAPDAHPLSLLDLSLQTPEENIALDEALLLGHDGAMPREILRFWESPVYFVTLGVSGKLHEDVDVDAGARAGVPILRRASGGGTVLQGPGCLNYALVLSLEARPELRDLTRSYRTILARVAEGLGVEGLAQQGTSDLALDGRKISGNAQKRTRRAVLHHGTVLHGFDLDRIPRFLREPAEQPEYRRRRQHGEFVTCLSLDATEIKSRLARAWGALPDATTPPLTALPQLIREKYGNPDWTARF